MRVMAEREGKHLEAEFIEYSLSDIPLHATLAVRQNTRKAIGKHVGAPTLNPGCRCTAMSLSEGLLNLAKALQEVDGTLLSCRNSSAPEPHKQTP